MKILIKLLVIFAIIYITTLAFVYLVVILICALIK